VIGRLAEHLISLGTLQILSKDLQRGFSNMQIKVIREIPNE
jgi:hypothetical protein